MYMLIQLKDLCCYENDFEYEPFLVKADTPNFEEKYTELVEVCSNYDNFQEIEDFISENFEVVNCEKRTIEI